MKTVTRRISFLISFFCIFLGVVLIAYNLNLISQSFIDIVIKLSPVTLIFAGIIFLRESYKKRKMKNIEDLEEKTVSIPVTGKEKSIRLNVSFTTGNLSILKCATNSPEVEYEQISGQPEPKIENKLLGNTSVININKAKPFFPFRTAPYYNWKIKLQKNIPLQINLQLQDSDLFMDLDDLTIEEVELRLGIGTHEIIFDKKQKNLSGVIYASSNKLSLIFPINTFIHIKLINPFCKIDYPQGDFSKNDKGIIISNKAENYESSFDFKIDGAIKHLNIDLNE